MLAPITKGPLAPVTKGPLPPYTFLLGLLLSLAYHLWALEKAPLERIDAGGAEYIPHLQLRLAQGLFPFDVWPPWHALIQLDGHYGGLLHIIGALWAQLGPSPSSAAALPWASHLSWLALALTAYGIHSLGARLSPHPGAGSMAGLLTLATPGLMFPAQRYYYDLPMSAALTGAALLLLAPRRQRLASLITGAALAALALLFKWAAGLYLLPIALLYAITTRRAPHLGRRLALGLAIPLTLTAPLLLNPGGSAAFQLGLINAETASPLAQPIHQQALTYAHAWVMEGSGPLLFLTGIAMLTLLSPGLRRAFALLTLLPITLLCLLLPSPDARYLLPLLPAFALITGLGLAALPPKLTPWLPRLTLALITLQLAWTIGAINTPSPAETAANWAALSPARHWWYRGGRASQKADIQGDKALAASVIERCAGGTLYLHRGRPHDLPAHPLRYWLQALNAGIDLRASAPRSLSEASHPLCILSIQGEPLPTPAPEGLRLLSQGSLKRPGAPPLKLTTWGRP